MMIYEFLSTLMSVFTGTLIIAGAFALYSGTKKKQYVGIGVILIAIVVGIAVVWFTLGTLANFEPPIYWGKDVLLNGLSAVAGVVAGAVIVLGIFFGVVLKIRRKTRC